MVEEVKVCCIPSAWPIALLSLRSHLKKLVKDGRVLAIGPPRELGVGTGGEAGGLQYKVAYRDASGRLVERQTEDPTDLLNKLTGEALARGERLEELSVGRPTLEDVYLELTADE